VSIARRAAHARARKRPRRQERPQTIARDAIAASARTGITRSGAVKVGDEVTLAPPDSSKLGEWAKKRATGLKRMLLRAAMPK
jgi:hypothetical protein